MVLDLEVLGRKHHLAALQRAADEAGHELLGALADLLAVPHGQGRHAAEVVAAQPSVELQVAVLVERQQFLRYREAVAAVVHADAGGHVVSVQERNGLGDVGIGDVLHVHAQDELRDPALGQLGLLEDDDLGRIVGVAEVAADPEPAGLRHEVEQHFQPAVGRLLGLAAAQLLAGDHALLVLGDILAAQVEVHDMRAP